MASPAEITLRNLNGKFVMNKTISTSPDPALALQGLGWLTRKAIGLATVTLAIKQYTDDSTPPVTHIDIEQTATGGIKGTREERTLDNTARPHDDHIFGSVKGRTRFVPLASVGDAEGGKGDDGDKTFVTEGWEGGEGEAGKGLEVVENFVESLTNGWTAWGVWGFQDVEGKRMYVRRICVRKGEECVKLRLVYDYLGAV